MSSISIKGVLLGALVDFLANLALGAGLLIAFAAPYEAEDFENAAQRISSGTGWLVSLAISCAIAMGAGYFAARIAGKGELINGTLSCFLSVTIGIFLVIAYWSEGFEAYDVVELATAPLFGLLGGYLRLRQVSGLR